MIFLHLLKPPGVISHVFATLVAGCAPPIITSFLRHCVWLLSCWSSPWHCLALDSKIQLSRHLSCSGVQRVKSSHLKTQLLVGNKELNQNLEIMNISNSYHGNNVISRWLPSASEWRMHLKFLWLVCFVINMAIWIYCINKCQMKFAFICKQD